MSKITILKKALDFSSIFKKNLSKIEHKRDSARRSRSVSVYGLFSGGEWDSEDYWDSLYNEDYDDYYSYPGFDDVADDKDKKSLIYGYNEADDFMDYEDVEYETSKPSKHKRKRKHKGKKNKLKNRDVDTESLTLNDLDISNGVEKGSVDDLIHARKEIYFYNDPKVVLGNDSKTFYTFNKFYQFVVNDLGKDLSDEEIGKLLRMKVCHCAYNDDGELAIENSYGSLYFEICSEDVFSEY